MAVRIDKFLWAVRIYKTRTVAADAVKMNRVSVGGAWVKASYDVKVGDVLDVRKGQITFRFRVLELVANRQPAKNVGLYIENITPQEELDKLLAPRETIFISRDRGTGRPTKKERRDIDALMEEFFLDELDD
ncbi:MAG: RNA-binding S4 domain-containing protein [Rikenellaceae bacterium]|jgi:ribosome-associated heat shock protein Hsp15|nr:RNA-binding S4 domain-containing protein [Rikenellaceae bacterium]